MREAFESGDNPQAAPVNGVVDTALDRMAEAGAELVDPVAIANIPEQIEETTVYAYYATLYLNEFLAEREAIPYDSVREIYEAGAYHEDLGLLKAIAEMTAEAEEELDFWRSSLGQESFRRDVLETFAADDLDAMGLKVLEGRSKRVDEASNAWTDDRDRWHERSIWISRVYIRDDGAFALLLVALE